MYELKSRQEGKRFYACERVYVIGARKGSLVADFGHQHALRKMPAILTARVMLLSVSSIDDDSCVQG